MKNENTNLTIQGYLSWPLSINSLFDMSELSEYIYMIHGVHNP